MAAASAVVVQRVGLTIARDLARCHHGTLALTAGPPGACFVLRLPRAKTVRNSLDNTWAGGDR